ncbi:MAG: aspartate aminotransferase family protein [Candidatus Bathyarchaeia archaeon]
MSEQAFIQKTQASGRLYERASRVLPSGVSGAGKYIKPYPLYLKSAQGTRLVDVDGNEYVDLLLGAGVNILGHSPAVVVEAVEARLRQGTSILIPTELEVEMAERIAKHMPTVEAMRFLTSGTEGTLMALRAARAYTGKDKIAKFEGHYHGQHDYSLVSGPVLGGAPHRGGPEFAPRRIMESAGIPAQVASTVEVLPFNNLEATEALLKKHAQDLAAVILEPVVFLGGCIPADREFLKGLREVTEQLGILLIFDEVVTGFRLGLGGAQEYYGVGADLTVLGKIIGGGFPIGAFGGRREIMEKTVTLTKDPVIDTQLRIFSSGTYTGNPIAMTSGLAVMRELEKGEVYPQINLLGASLKKGLDSIAEEEDYSLQCANVGSIFLPIFSKDTIRSRRDLYRADKTRATEFGLAMISRGFYLPPGHAGFISAAHTEEEIKSYVETARAVLRQVFPKKG